MQAPSRSSQSVGRSPRRTVKESAADLHPCSSIAVKSKRQAVRKRCVFLLVCGEHHLNSSVVYLRAIAATVVTAVLKRAERGRLGQRAS